MQAAKYAKRFRAIAIALAITFATNYAISLSVGTANHQSNGSNSSYASVSRSGANVPGQPPKP